MNIRTAAKRNRGFTLMELLVVMAISMILMVLVMAPVIRSFEMTRRAGAMVDAQDAARAAMQQISREVGEAMDVLDYTAESLELPVYNPEAAGTPDQTYWRKLPFAKIDLIMPRMVVHCNNPAHDAAEPRDFERGDEAMPLCPVCGSEDVEVKPRLPIEQGTTVVRYFLGLRYNNPEPAPTSIPSKFGWQSPWAEGVLADEGNQVVLYRIEFDPYDESIFGDDHSVATQRLMDVLRDPRFFYTEDYQNWSAADGRPLWQHWAEKARILGIAKYEDLVTGVDENNDGIFETLQPSVGFRFAKVDNDTLIGVDYGNTASEYPDAPPTAYRAKFGYWTPNSEKGVTLPLGVSAYRYGQNNDGTVNTATTSHYYTTQAGNGHLVVYKREGTADPYEVFDITAYMYAGQIDLDSIDGNTDMGFYFDHARTGSLELMNFNRGTVNFALNVEPYVLETDVIDQINADFAADFAGNRWPTPRKCMLPALKALRYAMVVPGSEVVMGPDATPGAPSGRIVRYARVSRDMGSAGLNEYQINYETGDIFFSRLQSQDLPNTAPMTINYKIQFNKDNDVVIANYVTKALIDVRVGIRMFDPESGKAHTVELNSRAQVRNAYR